MKKRIINAKVACLDMNLQKQRMNLGVHVTIDDPEQLEAIRKRWAVRPIPFSLHKLILKQRIRHHTRAGAQNLASGSKRHSHHKRHRRSLPERVC